MLKTLASFVLLVSATDAWAASNSTDFGIRTLSGPVTRSLSIEPAASRGPLTWSPMTGSPIDLHVVASLGSQWGRVTSTLRSAAHNRAVGGVRNSWHLRGRAIDIARRAGVTHAEIAAAYRNAGYYLIESLDEGDHSHFAFGSGGGAVPRARPVQHAGGSAPTQWRIVTVASAAFK